MGLNAKRRIRRGSSLASRVLQELCDISIDGCSLILLSALAAVTLYNIALAHAASALRLLGQYVSPPFMQLALALP